MGTAKKQEAALRSIKAQGKASTKATKQAKSAARKHASPDRKARANKASSGIAAMAPDGRPEPPFHYDIQVKKAQVLVDVVLHKVPPQHIDLSQCTARHLIVDCAKHTKKFLLDFELPMGMAMDPEKGEYTFESGVLKCILQCESATAEAQAARAKFLEKVTAGNKLRFRMSKEGEVVVRSRKATMAVPAQVTPASKELLETAAVLEGAVTGSSGAEGIAKKGSKADKADKKEAKAQKQQGGKYVSDKAMQDIAATAGRTLKLTLSQKLKASRQEQAAREHRSADRASRKAGRQEKEQVALDRMMDSQRSALAHKAEMAAPAPKKAATKQGDKKIKFSE